MGRAVCEGHAATHETNGLTTLPPERTGVVRGRQTPQCRKSQKATNRAAGVGSKPSCFHPSIVVWP
eukprot:11948028-Alexandrium_andersonii.AAC.1